MYLVRLSVLFHIVIYSAEKMAWQKCVDELLFQCSRLLNILVICVLSEVKYDE